MPPDIMPCPSLVFLAPPPPRPGSPDVPPVLGRTVGGDVATTGAALRLADASLRKALALRAGERVLEIRRGDGGPAPALSIAGPSRIAAGALRATVRAMDGAALAVPDQGVDAVLSTFGAMFARDQARAAREMARVCRPHGRIGMANWTPEGLVGQVLAAIDRHLPPSPGASPPTAWGRPEGLAALFGDRVRGFTFTEREVLLRARSPAHWMKALRAGHGPVPPFAAPGPASQAALEAEILALLARFNRATDGTVVAPARYLEVVATVRGG